VPHGVPVHDLALLQESTRNECSPGHLVAILGHSHNRFEDGLEPVPVCSSLSHDPTLEFNFATRLLHRRFPYATVSFGSAAKMAAKLPEPSTLYTYTEEDIAFEVYAAVHDIPTAIRPIERKKFLSKAFRSGRA
jgi:hypothetical protein